MAFYVYILASRRNGTLYIGMTDDLVKRIWLHKAGALRGFSKQYGIKTLVWYEQHDTRLAALTRERQMKKWNRAWKIELIEKRIHLGRTSMRDLLHERAGSPLSRGRTVKNHGE